MLILALVTAAIALVVFRALTGLHRCPVTFLDASCTALVGRRGHDRHLWDRDPWPFIPPVRPWIVDEMRERNRRALAFESRIAFSIMRPEAFVLGSYGP